jgi:hypothetical protein
LLIWKSDPPPSLQALGEILFYNIDEDVVSVVGNTPRASATTSSGLATGVHGARIRCSFRVERSVLSTIHGNT